MWTHIDAALSNRITRLENIYTLKKKSKKEDDIISYKDIPQSIETQELTHMTGMNTFKKRKDIKFKDSYATIRKRWQNSETEIENRIYDWNEHKKTLFKKINLPPINKKVIRKYDKLCDTTEEHENLAKITTYTFAVLTVVGLLLGPVGIVAGAILAGIGGIGTLISATTSGILHLKNNKQKRIRRLGTDKNFREFVNKYVYLEKIKSRPNEKRFYSEETLLDPKLHSIYKSYKWYVLKIPLLIKGDERSLDDLSFSK